MTEVRLKIGWGDLGAPTKPCVVDHHGLPVEVQQRNIDAAKGNAHAIFTATRLNPWPGPARYVLGLVEFPSEN